MAESSLISRKVCSVVLSSGDDENGADGGILLDVDAMARALAKGV